MSDFIKLALKSDFIDYYDHWFCSQTFEYPNAVFMRMMSQGMSRSVMMHYMRDIGITTPRFGVVADICGEKDIRNIVVHLNIRAHTGDGKVLMSASDAIIHHPDAFSVEYIQSKTNQNSCCYGRSLRLLKIGDRYFWLRYSSKNDWRSNAGNVTIETPVECFNIPFVNSIGAIQHSLFAIDFVEDGEKIYAIDFNESPGLRGTGIENFMSGNEIFIELTKQYRI